jgi:integrase
MAKRQLTAVAVEKLRPGQARREIRDGTGALLLIIQTSGVKSWAMRFIRPNGKTAKLTLGRYDSKANQVGELVVGQTLSLGMARALAIEVGRRRTMGLAEHRVAKLSRNRIAARNAESSFGIEARHFIDEYEVEKGSRRGQRPRTWRETAKLLGLDYPLKGGEPTVIKGSLADIWRDMPVATITQDAILDLIDETQRSGIPGIEARSGKSENRGRHLSSALGTFFKWLTAKRKIAVNPFVGMRRPRPGNTRKRILNFRVDMNDADEIRWFWKGCQQIGGPFGAVTRLLLLTACRLDEIAKMESDELNTGMTVLRLPGERTKNGLDHEVFIPPPARAILETVPRISNRFIFSTNGRTPSSGFSKWKKKLDAAMLAEARKEKGADFELKSWRLHDLRRTAASGMGALKVAPHVVEFVLNHAIAGYNLEEYEAEKREAWERWADHVAGIVDETPEEEEAKVVSIRKGKP